MTDHRDAKTFYGPVTFENTVTFETAPTVGDGTGSPSQAFNKVDAGTFDLLFQNGGTNRWAIRHDASENLLIRRFNASAVLQDTVTFNGSSGLLTLPAGLTVAAGTVDLSAASLTPPTGQQLVRTWTSGSLTQASLTPGASQSIAVPTGGDGAFPTGIIPVGAYFETTGTATSSSGDTTGLTVALAVGSAEYLAVGASILGAASKKENATGALIGGYRAADTPTIELTALGAGSEDLADINALALRVVIKYLPIT